MSKSDSDSNSKLLVKSVPQVLDFANSVKRTYFYSLVNYFINSTLTHSSTLTLNDILNQVSSYNFAYFIYAEFFIHIIELITTELTLLTSLIKTVIVMSLSHWYLGNTFDLSFVKNITVICSAMIIYHFVIQDKLEVYNFSPAVKDLIQSLFIYVIYELAGERQFNVKWFINSFSKLLGIWLYYQTSRIEESI